MNFNRWLPVESLNEAVVFFSVFVMMVLTLPQCDYQPPRITLQPVSQTANPGSRVEFAIQAQGGQEYFWSKDGQLLDGQLESSLVLENITAADEGDYTCTVANSKGEAISDPATLTVNDPPEIRENFLAQTVFVGQEIILSGQVAGTRPLVYRIFHNNRFVGETTECYWNIETATESDGGFWRFSVTNITGVSVRSDPVEVVVRQVIMEGEVEGAVEGEIIIEGQLEGEGEVDGETPPEGEGETPIEGEGEAEIIPEGEGEILFPLCQNNFCLTANFGDNPLPPINLTFCEAFGLLYNNAPRPLLGDYASLVDYFTPQGDLNGYSWVDKRQAKGLILYQIGGNGLPDCSFELKLLERVLNDPNLCICQSGLNHKAVHEAWDANFIKLAADFGTYWELGEILLPGFRQIICGYATIGDGEVDYSVENYATANGSLGLVLGVAYLFGDKIPNSQPNPDDYLKFPEWFGPSGDADGDGWTNVEEYSAAGGDADAYAAAALDPEIVP